MSADDAGELHEAYLLAEAAVTSARARALDAQMRLDAVRTTLSVVRELLVTTEEEVAVAAAEAREARAVRQTRAEAWTARLLVELAESPT